MSWYLYTPFSCPLLVKLHPYLFYFCPSWDEV